MPKHASDSVFDGLTAKQFEALNLAANGFTSKEIARKLEISPHSVDKRIDAVRAQLDAMPRQMLVREFRDWNSRCQSTTGGPSPLTDQPLFDPNGGAQSADETLVFGDALAFGTKTNWEEYSRWQRPEIRPSDLGVGRRLLLVLAAAFLAAAAFVLVAAAGNVLVDMLG